ncbi:MAG TPA: efflux RND transporter periplasmic adaptor subunit [Candidatus Aminicenantes bacterium]|nr:efflux RND transporter periplasmic adaptor subunit [Candidatus Aminicenantes bacterium]
MTKKYLRYWMILFAAISLLPIHCRKGRESAGAPPVKEAGRRGAPGIDRSKITYPVEAREIQLRSLVYSVNAVGSVDAFEKVQVTARVSGVVDRVLFSEGNYAKVDQVLVEVEPERYRLAVEAAQAAYEKALASKADAESGLKRRETVVTQTPGLIPGEEVETWRTKVLLANSDVAQTRAALNQAKLNLHDAYVRAPFSGIIQTRTVQTGQYVQTGTVLATLVRRDPLLLRFKVPERDASQFSTGLAANFKVRNNDKEFSARIIHVAASADQETRLVDVTAEINDPKDGALRPGSFAEIVVPVRSARTAPVIPQTAIRPSERGFLAFVVEDGKAVERILNIGMRTADGLVEVLSGVNAGETLVVRGAEALRTGVAVRIVEAVEKGPEAQTPK